MYLAGSGHAHTADEVARAIHARVSAVRRILRNDPRFVLHGFVLHGLPSTPLSIEQAA